MPGAITRWDPFAELGELRSRLEEMFGDLAPERRRSWIPAIDVVRGEDSLVLRADIPGIRPEDVKIQVEDDILTVSGEHEERAEDRHEQYVRRERRYGSFSRSMALPAGIDPEQITATTRDGVVEVTIPLPKAQEKKTVQITPTSG